MAQTKNEPAAPKAPDAEREARLAKALRANLRRRKQSPKTKEPKPSGD